MSTHTQEELTALALHHSTTAQHDALVLLIERGFRIFKTRSEGPVMLVFVTHPNVFGVVYPDGQLHRPAKGRKTVDYNWNRARALYDAQHAKKETV